MLLFYIIIRVRGDFYLRTKGKAPFDASETPKEDL